jgi:orotidine-5'-phosphate decarboxylase
MKLHDIPTTVRTALRACSAGKARHYVNFHAAVASTCCAPVSRVLAEGAAESGGAAPKAIAVHRSDERLRRVGGSPAVSTPRSQRAVTVLCARMQEVHARARLRAPTFVTIVPGSRFADSEQNDQARLTQTRRGRAQPRRHLWSLESRGHAAPDARIARSVSIDAVSSVT